MKYGRNVSEKACTSAATGFLKEKCSEEKSRFTAAPSFPPLSTGEKRWKNKTMLEMLDDH